MELLKNQPPPPLSAKEKRLFTRLEKDIEQNLKGFLKVGFALVTIRDQKLYREYYTTFEEYCREEWDLGRSRAYQLIDSHDVMEHLSTMVDKSGVPTFRILPANERQTRPMIDIPMEQRGEAWTMVLEEAEKKESKITASFTQHCIDALREKKVSETINKAQVLSKKKDSLPKPLQLSLQNFLDELNKNRDESFDLQSRKELAKVLRELLHSIEL